MRENSRPYTYADVGYNGFLRRSIASSRSAITLHDMSRQTPSPSSLNFDNMQVSGSLGDSIEVGRFLINGADGQLDLRAEASDDVLVRIGEINGRT